MVKVFPASQMGPDYFKTILGPFDRNIIDGSGRVLIRLTQFNTLMQARQF